MVGTSHRTPAHLSFLRRGPVRTCAWRGVTLLLPTGMLLGCCKPEDDVVRLEALASWGATAELVAEAWIAGQLPRAYSARAVRLAGGGRAREARIVGEDGRPVGRFDGAVGALVTVLAGGDRAGAEVACAGLSAEVRELRGAASVARAGP